MNTQSVPYRDEETPLTGFFAWDDDVPERRPGILVVHAGTGLDDHTRSRSQMFAALGLVAFACDMYGDGTAGDRERVMGRLMQLRNDPALLLRRAQAGLRLLESHPKVDGRLAAVGFCFGGMTVLQLARSGANLAGAISIHGSLKTATPAEPGHVKAKILVCHGALDSHVPIADVAGFMEEMNRAGADYQLIAYGGAMHGFAHDNAAIQLPGVAYHALTDKRSFQAIRTFLAELF